MELSTNTVGKVYEVFYQAFTKDYQYKVNLFSENNQKLFSNFLANIREKEGKPLGIEGLIHFCCFQFFVWKDKETATGGKVKPSQAFGKKAQERWFKRDHKNDWLLEGTLNDLKISKLNLIKSFQDTYHSDYKKLNLIEEGERERYLNTGLGLAWCMDYTSLFNPASEICQRCKFSENCKKVLKIRHPKIYSKRGLNKKTNGRK